MPPLPAVVVFDVNETLSDLAPMADAFAAVGAPRELAAPWFAGALRDGFARCLVGAPAPFAEVLGGVLRPMLAGCRGLDRPLDEAVDRVLAGFGSLTVHPDVVAGIRALAALGPRLVTLTNGATSVGDALLTRAGVRDAFERLLSVEDAPSWKPEPRSYAYAAAACGVTAGEMLLVAVHPWDIDGARRAGLRTAWVDRSGTPYPAHFLPAELVVTGIDGLAADLGAGMAR